ncbi:carbonic anhydrase (plasmid) [Sphingomonas paeninsulae]|jgi:carbonic anhydrase|uniref:carbonic anhydrase n=1 Tax=Sphingomonas paeninsulae TaxID=2319844 RepID=A0A494TBL4_SPHPE|nr:carbonic anhydrase [Sphingomonas paeninsulae]AYJ84624.1 carbonic anhydrase [Sphingomonas paeninsulae]
MVAPPQLNEVSELTGSDGIADLFERNRRWANRKTLTDPHFFERLVGQQSPQYFWVGCSDSRVPATEIVDLEPGEMFVHRNIANLAPANDVNFNAALLFSVNVLRVRHILVVGHYCCGGIRASRKALANDAVGMWLAPVRALCWQHRGTLYALPDEQAREDRLCELNVVSQVEKLCANPLVKQAWEDGYDLTVHGLIYAIGDGLLQRVCAPVSGIYAGGAGVVSDDDDDYQNIL